VTDVSQVPPGGPGQEVPPAVGLDTEIYPNQVDDEAKEIERGRGRRTGSENGRRAFGSRSDFLSIGTER
jgi:hypothetical protein